MNDLRHATLSLVSDDGFHDVIITHSTRAAAERTYEALEGGMIRYLADATFKAAIGSLCLVAILEGLQWASMLRQARNSHT